MSFTQRGNDIDGEAAGDLSGQSVSLSSDGTVLAIGAYLNDGNNGTHSGHTRIYAWNGSAWVQRGSDIDGEAHGDYSGYSVSLSSDGSTVAIGATFNDGINYVANSGHTRIYKWDGSSWNKLGSDIDGEAVWDRSGHSVSLSSDGSTVAIGAIHNDGNGSYSGHTRIYAWNGSAWVQRGSDIDGEAAGDQSGHSVSLSSDGSTVAIGAIHNDGNGSNSGHTRIYAWNGSAWVQRGSDIDGEAAGDQSGHSVSLSSDGNVLAIGANQNDGNNGTHSGHTRIYAWNGSAWVQRGSDIDGEAAYDNSGRSVSLSSDGSVLAIGAHINDGNNGEHSGHTRIYAWNGSAWVQRGSDIDGEAAYDNSGQSVSLSSDGSILAIGANENDGNGSYSGHVRVFSLDNTPPTIAVSSDVSSLKAGETATLTFTLPESSSDFTVDDVSVSGGTLADFSGSGSSYSATFTPTADSTTDGAISVANSKFSDAAGNTNADGSDANNSLSLTVDTVRPTIAVSSDVSSLKAGETATLSFTLSESSTTFAADDLTVSGGTLSNFSGSGTSYSATFTPTADSTTDGAISVANSKFSDAAGNTNADGSDANNSVNLTVDSVRPTIAISSDVSSLRADETATLTFTLSDVSTDFIQSDITVSGGTLSNFSGSGTSYSATFTPTADSTTDCVVSVANNKFCDAAGNSNQDGNDLNNIFSLKINRISATETENQTESENQTEIKAETNTKNEIEADIETVANSSPQTSETLLLFAEDPITNYSSKLTSDVSPVSSRINTNQGLMINYSIFDTYGRGEKIPETKKEEDGGVKIIELSKTNSSSDTQNSIPREEQQSIGVVLTKKPSSTVDVQVSVANSKNLKIINPKITFTPGNWQVPQEIKIEGCTNESIKLTFTAKAGNQGGFKGTETDVLTTQIRQQKSCNRQAISSAKSNPKQPKQIETTPPIESNFPEFNSPLFLILRLLLKPIIFSAKITDSLLEIMPSKASNKENESGSPNHSDSAESHITHDGHITADFFRTTSSPVLETKQPINNQMNEANLVSTNPSSPQNSPSPWL